MMGSFLQNQPEFSTIHNRAKLSKATSKPPVQQGEKRTDVDIKVKKSEGTVCILFLSSGRFSQVWSDSWFLIVCMPFDLEKVPQGSVLCAFSLRNA